MNLFIIPQDIKVTFGLDSGLQNILQQLIDQASDRAEAVKLTTDVKAQADALKNVVSPP